MLNVQMRQIFFLCCVFALSFVAVAQPDLKFSTLSIKDGLSSNSINDIIKDELGFIWIATDDGLNRYDGQEIKIFHHSDSITGTIGSNTAYCLIETDRHQLLIGTQNGFCVYDGIKDQFRQIALDSVKVKNIIQSQFNDNLYLSTDRGLYIYSETFDFIRHYDEHNSNLPTSALKDVQEDLEGNIWVAAYTFGAYELLDNGNFKAYTFVDGNLDAHYVECLEIRENGDVLISSYDHGVFKLDLKLDKFVSLPCENCEGRNTKVIELYEDAHEKLWAGFDGGGLGLYDDEKEKFYYYEHRSLLKSSINDDVISKVYNDRKGGLWVGSFYRGVNFVNLFSSDFAHLEEIKGASDHNIVSCILEDNDQNLWIATDGGGIVHYSKDHELIESYNITSKPFIASNSTLHMAFDKEGGLWVGTYFGGLQYIDTEKRTVEIFKHIEGDSTSISANVIWKVYIDSNEDVWLATQQGISRFNKDTKTFTNYNKSNSPLKSENIRVMHQDKRGDYWFGSEYALYRLDKKGVFHEYIHDVKDTTSICNNWIVTINDDVNGNVWFGSYGGGISKYDPDKDNFTSWDERDGLCNNFICGILADDNNDLWVSTFKGLSHFRVKQNKFKTYHAEDGLQGGKFSINSYYKSKEGVLMFGGINGLTSFRHEDIASNPYPPSLVLTDFRLMNEPVDIRSEDAPFREHISHVKEIVLPYDYSVFTIQFAALNYIQSNKNQFVYKLKGFDKEWNHVGNKNEATYTNLTPGKYVFQLKASNNNNIWTEDPLTLSIIIEPPFYRTWWFRIVSVLIVIFALVSVYKLRVERIVRQKQLLKRIVDERTETIHLKNKELEYKNQNHLESLNYAKLIQEASLPSLEEAREVLDSFGVLYLPSHIVSGDFYWIKNVQGKLIIASVDCTGHGVPGAFMSLIGHVALGNIISWRGLRSPEDILEALHEAVVKSLRQNMTSNKDGMDMSIVVIDKEAKTMEFAGAMNPLVYIQNNEVKQIKGVRRGVGGMYLFNRNPFEKHIVDISVPTTFYLYTDGYQDQFGGRGVSGGKKFMAKRFRDLLLEIHELPFDEQIEVLNNKHLEWKGDNEQTDDVLVLGGKIDF